MCDVLTYQDATQLLSREHLSTYTWVRSYTNSLEESWCRDKNQSCKYNTYSKVNLHLKLKLKGTVVIKLAKVLITLMRSLYILILRSSFFILDSTEATSRNK